MPESLPPDNEPEKPSLPQNLKPVSLPKPDGFGDINQQAAVNRAKAKAEKKKGKWWSRSEPVHPKDAFTPVKPKRSCGCAGCFMAVIILLASPCVGIGLWYYQVRHELAGEAGYRWRTIVTKNVPEAPSEKAALFGPQVLYEAKETPHEIAFVGGYWWIGGTFHEKVTFRGVQLVAEPGTRFLKGLDCQAIFLDLGDAVIEGELTGGALRQQ